MSRYTIYLILSIFIIIQSIFCGISPIDEASSAEEPKVDWVIPINTTDSSISVLWKCNSNVEGFLKYNEVSKGTTWLSTFFPSEHHFLTISGLTSNSQINFQVSCGLKESGIYFPISWRTNPNLSDIYMRSIWLVGGIGTNKLPIAEIDLYDPIANTWYNNITSIPTPRINPQVISHKGKIYIMGGIISNGLTMETSNLVEVYDPFINKWRALPSMPSRLQGGIIGTVDDSIFLLAGSTTTDMTTGTIFDNIMRFDPELLESGRWQSYLSATSIFPRVDMGYCTFKGSIYFTGGRFHTNGLPQSTTDAFVPSANSTTGRIEPAISLARHGMGSTCYRPSPSDIGSADPGIFLIAGGSSSIDITQPVNSNIPSNRFEFSILGTQLNNFTTGNNLPIPVYSPSMEISYENRKVYIFGGATEINLPIDRVYSLDLSNPSTSGWIEESDRMPRPRFGHKAVILNR